ncbi:MAG TPA: hypothetical protein PLI90_03340 [Rhodocyclaceae bacterium]|nr:hypothetical protein [Rhodocyclaceae bacterium]
MGIALQKLADFAQADVTECYATPAGIATKYCAYSASRMAITALQKWRTNEEK